MVSLTDDAYRTLSKEKLPNESFSKTVIRLTSKKKRSFMDLAGKWEGGTDEAKKIFDDILKERHKLIKVREFEL